MLKFSLVPLCILLLISLLTFFTLQSSAQAQIAHSPILAIQQRTRPVTMITTLNTDTSPKLFAEEGGEGAEGGEAEGEGEGGEGGGLPLLNIILFGMAALVVIIILAVLINECKIACCAWYAERKAARREYTDSERFELELRAASHWQSDPKVYQSPVQ